MNYNYIENLVKQSKDGDISSKEKLIDEFKPFIINVSKKTYIYGYDFEDIVNECYRILLKCISIYKLENHRFVGYATNGIKNSINDLIKRNLKNDNVSGSAVFTIDSFLEDTFKDDVPEIDDFLCSKYDCRCLEQALSTLNKDELELIYNIYFADKTLKSYADEKQLCYSSAFKKKKRILNKLFTSMHIDSNISLNNCRTQTSVC